MPYDPSHDISTIPDYEYERKHTVLQISKSVYIWRARG
jgi:hypothetical protein